MHLHFTQSLEPLHGAGLGGSALGLHQGFLEAGIRSTLLTTRGVDFAEEWEGVVQCPRKGPTKAFYAPDLRRIANETVAGASVVHGHGFYVYPNRVLGGLARKNSKPLVYHIQGFLDPWILARSKLKKRLAHWWFENANFRHVSWWRAVSPKERDQAIRYGVRAPVEILPNGVHMPAERSTLEVETLVRHFPRKREKRLIFLSRIHPKKGLDLLMKAWSALDASLVRDWEIAIFGPDEGGHQAEIESLIRDLQLEESVQFFGSVSGEAKEAAYRSADLFVLPSRSEGFPMAVLEAASYGLPVVQTNECNFPELTAAGGGWEAMPEIQSLQAALHEALATDHTEREQRGAAGRKLVAEHYQWSAIAEKTDAYCRHYCLGE